MLNSTHLNQEYEARLVLANGLTCIMNASQIRPLPPGFSPDINSYLYSLLCKKFKISRLI